MSVRKIRKPRVKYRQQSAGPQHATWKCPSCKSNTVVLNWEKRDEHGNLPEDKPPIQFVCTNSACKKIYKETHADYHFGPAAVEAVRRIRLKQKEEG